MKAYRPFATTVSQHNSVTTQNVCFFRRNV